MSSHTAPRTPDPSTSDSLPGLDLDRLCEYLERARPGLLGGPVRARLVTGGRSNLTYEVTDGRRSWIVRRPPLGPVLGTAHDMAREARVLAALGPTEVPVPRVDLFCEDPTVIGAPFIVMERVGGRTYRRAAEIAPSGVAAVRTMSTHLVNTLGAIHSVDPVAAGLADLGRAEGFLHRQVRRWRIQLGRAGDRGLAGADALHAALASGVPEAGRTRLVHGDYRLDNVLVDAEHRVTGVIDWELATLGDPLTDLALLLVYHRMARSHPSLTPDAPTAPGFLSEAETLDRYATVSGLPVPDMGFYLGLAYFKIAVILEGVRLRSEQGHPVKVEGIESAAEELLDAGLAAVREQP
ncbi:phosphotransferase family protein [Pseudonocardia pini]|uniref:phosphotransferase family protein n=1 Tax=Pseudonocardia pini TaxID=2758030 RepID=UPI0015F036D1|nr:phosphotransferase family protein [Pseudonocardia pini]